MKSNGIGEAWRPRPTRFDAELMTARYDEANPAPERDGWDYVWKLASDGRAPTRREVMRWTGWGSTKATRVRHEAVTAFEKWSGTPPAVDGRAWRADVSTRKDKNAPSSATPNAPAANQTRDTKRATRSAARADRSDDARHQTRQPGDTPRTASRARVPRLDTSTTTVELDIARPVVAAVESPSENGHVVKARKPRKRREPSTAYHRTVAVWDSEHRTAFGVAYPWTFPHPDNGRVRVWMSTAKIVESDPEPGLERLRVAVVVYFDAVKTHTAWPRDDPATTKHFTNDIAKWLRAEPTTDTVQSWLDLDF